MDIKDTVAIFQLQGTRIVNLEIKNDFINLPDDTELKKSISLGNTLIEINGDKDESEKEILTAKLQLKVEIVFEHKNSNKEINIALTVEGFFTFSDIDEDKFKQMLSLNGNSSLYTIIRSYMTTISALTLEKGKIVLPMINFLKLSEELKKQKENETDDITE